jgi:NAD(P)-dependent dehydrogenase (short-subunit alcohol dehydrogenase family)
MRALVTGASDGIGGATCLRLAKRAQILGQPAHIVLTTSGAKAPPADLMDRLSALGARPLHLTGDLSDPAVCAAIARDTLEALGGLDCFVSNAGAMTPGPLAEVSLDVWRRMFDVNVTPTLLLAQALRPALVESRGAIVAVSSMSGEGPHRGAGAYSCAKAALSQLCRNLAQEWAPDGIRVNAVAPGMVATPLTARIYAHSEVKAKREALVPLGRVATPEDIAGVVAFLAGPDSAYVTGQVILADGGLSESALSHIPGLPKP